MEFQSLQHFLDTPVPHTQKEFQEWLNGIWSYVQGTGNLKAIAELAESDALEGSEPASQNPIYLGAYKAALSFHSINAKAE